ncbi:PREDICTED: growth arrest-specific protein 8-like [Nicrophorus vespilloides]|uniref:Dynein regulatory complex subunit 4 n=2 Tax=Nicrophorus vespilloides TaxID=110193 RepID=A0ABM1M678_NICVS|nr:PREDICTED: growth arrest-specific protein 8-like [Nicrophorus vespilloides]
MPPKKGKGKGKTAIVIDGVDTSSMSREQLEVFALRLKEENEREREERNFFQLERDKLRTFWEITRTELDEAKAKLRNKDRQIEESTEKNDEELRFYKQKVKHLQYEHQNNLTECKAEAMVSIKLARDDHAEQERELLRDKRELKAKGREQEMANQDHIKSLKMHFSEELYKAREEFETQTKEIELKYEKKFGQLRDELGIQHKMEMTEVEERKNTQISDLIRNHEKAFNEMKNYYNDITLNNLALISSLKDQMEVLKKQNERMGKQVADLTADNRRMAEPLKQALVDVTEYKRQLQNYEKDKLSLAHTKSKLQATKKELDDLRWVSEAMELRFEKLQAEKDELEDKFMKAVLDVQRKTATKNGLLVQRIGVLVGNAERRECIIAELGDHEHRTMIKARVDKMLDKKNKKISDLQYEFAKIAKAYDDLILSYEAKLKQYGIPVTELGFTPMTIIPSGQGAPAKGPAGIITKNK